MNNKLISELYNKIDALEKINKEQVLEIAELKENKDKAIENCKKSIESINQKLQDDKTIKVVDGKVVNMNEYQIVRLKAIRMKCKEFLEILGDKK